MESPMKRITALIVFVCMLLTSVSPLQAFGENVATLQFDGTQSAWAEPELKEAYDNSLTYEGVMNNYTRYITREEFCTLVIKLYEKLTNKIPTYSGDPFKDTDNKEILKAYELGIVKGTSSDTFAPKNNITRQEICVMIYRALSVSIANLDGSGGDFPFEDKNKIAAWALDAMKFAYKNSIMKGVSQDTIDPLSNTTREQSIILLLRTFKKYSSASASIENIGTVTVQKGPAPIKDENKKLSFTIETNNIFFPKFDEKINLYVSSREGKPGALPKVTPTLIIDNGTLYAALDTSITRPPAINPPVIKPPVIEPPVIDLPEDPILIKPNLPDLDIPIIHPPLRERTETPKYIKADFGAFIDKNKNTTRWFSFSLKDMGTNTASKVVWQVSETPFSGFKDSFKTDKGIVLTGEASVSSKEFSIDFSKINKNPNGLRSPITQNQKTYYVRAVPVDALGSPIGDPGKGMAVLYGEAELSYTKDTESKFELWTPKSETGNTNTEVKDYPVNDPFDNGKVVNVNAKSSSGRFFHLYGMEDNAQKVVIQVYDQDFIATRDYLDETDLVYSKEYTMSELMNLTTLTNYKPSFIVDFKQFGKDPAQMLPEDYVRYFVRAVAITDDIEPGALKAEYSDIVTVKYGFEKTANIIAPPVPPSKYDKTVMVNYSIPNVKIVGYKAIEWADPEYLSHYYVFREPQPNEILCYWKKDNTTLKPYFITDYKSAEYKSTINKVLPVGGKVYIPEPEPKDEPWYKELYNGIVDFFKTLVSTISKIYNKINETYMAIRTKLVEAVVSLCPFESWRGTFAMALNSLIDYGLTSLGIPPRFPNFEQLAEGNIEYLTEVALTEAGIPSSMITEEIAKKTADGIMNQFKESSRTSDHNPVNAAFLKLDPDYLYKPAYLEVELENNTNYPTVPGTLDLNVQFKLRESGFYATSYDPVGLNLTNDTYEYSYNPLTAMKSSTEYWNHFVYGLNGYTVDYKYGGIFDGVAVYEVFKPIEDLKLPSVPANSSLRIKIYFEHGGFASTRRYPDAEQPRYEDFYNMYETNGGADYTWFELSTSYPEYPEFATEQLSKNPLQQGSILIFDPKTEYRYHTDYSYGFNTGRTMQMPVNTDW